MTTMTGGCQCGFVRFSCEAVAHASICHCRMCQKAFGNAFAPLVRAVGLVWTRGEPKRFASSNKVRRGFCGDCGTPLTYEAEGRAACLSICAFDAPADIAPVIQYATERKLPWVDGLAALPTRPDSETAAAAAYFADLVSFQHPDHDNPKVKR